MFIERQIHASRGKWGFRLGRGMHLFDILNSVKLISYITSKTCF